MPVTKIISSETYLDDTVALTRAVLADLANARFTENNLKPGVTILNVMCGKGLPQQALDVVARQDHVTVLDRTPYSAPEPVVIQSLYRALIAHLSHADMKLASGKSVDQFTDGDFTINSAGTHTDLQYIGLSAQVPAETLRHVFANTHNSAFRERCHDAVKDTLMTNADSERRAAADAAGMMPRLH